MNLVKNLLVGWLYIVGLISVIVTTGAIWQVREIYSLGFPATLGPRFPAFSETTLDLMRNIVPIGFVLVATAILLLGLVWIRVRDVDARRFWILAVAAGTLYVPSMLVTNVLVGFFMLPKAANMM